MNPLWITGRVTGLVSLVLLTATLLLGCLHATGREFQRWPRFMLGLLHRNLALVAVTFLAVHVTTAVIDPYAGIGWWETVVPFSSTYDPFALGLGAVALDLLLAVLVTSLLRAHLSRRAWRAVHLGGYACWPLALTHGFLIGGADSATVWVLAVYVCCGLVGGFAVLHRLTHRSPVGARPSAVTR